ncbi:hypothetical protein FMK67_02970 [Klebsiella michiganensis]|uniref:Uncharacterized protein n=1 Tax=Klebsiella michiganensis TaxID=1134687 RepID=A0A1Q8Z2G6_9ENTR|nr:hypothetical protein A225_0473 [Klebsiella michiganensis E718]ARB25507.1 hypothetical protein AM394_20550 [Klebsiella oxytoca]ASK77198.1 hypothetical protein CF000_19830 [Klebsiella michiganensis]EJU33197.1 hypothetical protein HMPREF1144_1581 [Klebsiella sp. OBRC7]KAB5492878.1 hypothetical protein F8562_14180 [Klebsiella sp. RCJ4]
MSNLQADTVTCLCFDRVKSWGCHLCSFFGGDSHAPGPSNCERRRAEKRGGKHISHSTTGKTLSPG